MHDPAYQTEVQEARRLGGLRRKREISLQVAFDYEGIGSVEAIQRLIDIGIMEAFSVETPAGRARLLFQGAGLALKAHEVGELQDRLAALEAAVQRSQRNALRDQAHDFALGEDDP
jgi:hypothetical protein